LSEDPVTEANLQAYVDDRLAPDRRHLVTAWLAVRPDEAARLQAYREQRDTLRAALRPVVEEPLPPALDLRLHKSLQQGRSGWRRAAIAASAAGLMALGGAGGWTLKAWNTTPRVGVAALAREGAMNYAVYASDSVRPVDMGVNERRALDAWFSERLGRPIRAPDLGPAGLTLIGGRLVATEHGPAGLYLYRDAAGTRMALYVRLMEVDGSSRMTHREHDGVNGWTWADRGLGFGVFGAAPDDRLHGTADLVRAQYRRT
jgi:anti-sigma factor RsiW